MKKLLIYISIAIFFISCKSGEVEYPDYTYQTVYFPVQYPVRNIQLGEARYDNSLDLDSSFTIGVNISGMYKNTKERTVYVRYAPELVTNADTMLLTDLGDTIKVLPANYYTPDLSTLEKIVIPAGKFDGRIKIKLNSKFYNDPKTIGVRYVIPLVIIPSKRDTVFTGIRPISYILGKNTATTLDSVLIGRPAAGLKYPNRVITGNWLAGFTPMDFTLYGIKYTNVYHGNYFHYGVDSTYKATVLTTKRYSTPNVESNTITMLKTISLTESTIDRLAGTNLGAKYTVKLKFNADKTISLTSVPSLPLNDHVVVTGSGKYIEPKDGISWGGKGRKTIVLKYAFTDTNGTHNCTDTIVYRTDAIVYQDFKIRQLVAKRARQ